MLWSAKPGYVDNKGEVLKKVTLPVCRSPTRKPPPYGQAAMETLDKLKVLPALQPKDRAGKISRRRISLSPPAMPNWALSPCRKVYVDGKLTSGSMWQVPGTLYSPIRQDAVVLNKGAGKPAVQALMTYLKSAKARAVIHSHGYDLP